MIKLLKALVFLTLRIPFDVCMAVVIGWLCLLDLPLKFIYSLFGETFRYSTLNEETTMFKKDSLPFVSTKNGLKKILD